MQALFFDDINPAAERFFEIGDQPTREEWCRLCSGLDQKIEIAVGSGFAAGEGAEDFDVRDTVLGWRSPEFDRGRKSWSCTGTIQPW